MEGIGVRRRDILSQPRNLTIKLTNIVMNKTIIININSIVFHIEEDAYENLRSYMIEIKRHFGKSEDSREILEDIENRIAEMFSERIHSGRKEVINMLDVSEVITQMGRVSDFENEFADEPKAEGTATADAEGNNTEKTAEGQATEESTYTESNFAEYTMSKRLMRDMDDKILGGVCSGLGQYFNIDSKWVRVIFVLFFLFGGSGVLLYFVLWAVMPKALTRADKLAMRGEQANLHNFKKSFDEEMKELRENFSGTGEHINRGVRSVGDVLGSVFSIIGKIMAVITLIVSGLTVIGLFFVYVMNVLNLIGYRNEIFFPPLEMLDSSSAFFALTAGTLAVGIPFLALFFLMLRILFKAKSSNNYVNMSMLAIWIASIITIIYFVVVTQQDFREESTISVEKPLEKRENYVFEENDVRVIKTSDENFKGKKFDITYDGKNILEEIRSDVRIRFEAIDSLKAPYLAYNYIANGKTYGEASEFASQIRYGVNQTTESIVFDSHFSINSKPVYRDQRVSMVVYLPIGSKVTVNRTLENKFQNGSLWDCSRDPEQKYSEWLMTKDGLKCVRKLEEDKLKEEEKAKEEAEKEAKKAEKAEKKKNKQAAEATNSEEEASTEESEA